MLYALILAGGKGTRLYPLSREENPKQFLNIINNKSFLRNTVDRIKKVVALENIYMVTNKDYYNKICEEIPELNKENIFVEPANKETPYFRMWAEKMSGGSFAGTLRCLIRLLKREYTLNPSAYYIRGIIC